ncbi:ADAMTS-like protein 5 isoform X2 [Phalacrocorax aristotelis]|uniref:ADAMTS-like protein 5 isoform X2 n=1 Tax=Phalacrocorax aristotelis TaxID=126867 RepID=UPI003F4B9115
MTGWGCRDNPVPHGGPHGAGRWRPWRWLLLLAWLSLGCGIGTAKGSTLGTPVWVPEPPAPARHRRQPARGTWGPWGPWSSCSSTCGDGVALRTRRCLRSAEEEPCTGDPRQYRLCQLQGCPGGSVPFRAMQCSLYDNKPVLGTPARYRWVPFHGAPNVCDLNCLAVGHNFYYTFGRVLDGTRCGPDSPDLCVGGRCLSVGCDGILGSGTRPDACGQCGSGHDTCLFVHRLFQGVDPSSGYFGYMNVTKIPAGATHIKVTDKSRNYLGRCGRCRPAKGRSQRIRHFCQSDFVFQGRILARRLVGQETRYEVEVKTPYRHHFPLVTREYVWVPNTCGCPPLREGGEYLLMARRHVNYERTLNRILLQDDGYARPWTPREDRLVREAARHCPQPRPP